MTILLPAFIADRAAVEHLVNSPVSIDGLVGPHCIFQRTKGHRHSNDDAFTAWYALQKAPNARSVLDLGSGIGSVGISVLWGLGADATLTCVEAQDLSFNLLNANIRCNALGSRVQAIHLDLRNLDLPHRFPLVTASPPYFPPNTGVVPADNQKAYARFELRGDIGDYARTAKRHLTDDGVFVFCFPFQQKIRAVQLVTAEGFGIVSVRDIVPHQGKAVLFSVYAAQIGWGKPTIEEPTFTIAGEDLRYTDEMLALQQTRGFGPEGTNR